MGAPIRDIVIVGGGTTGWLTAAHLNHRLQWGLGHGGGVRITLIESPEIPIIGVGEATIPPIRNTLAMLDIDENEFIARTQATFKLGVRFEDWDRDARGAPRSYFHSFTGGLQIAGRNPAASFLAYGAPPEFEPGTNLSNVIGHAVAAAGAHKSPRRPSDRPYSGVLNYAYHFDAALFADFLKEVCIARGVAHVSDTVTGAERDSRGNIAALHLKQGGRRPVELVIDCSGFRGLLINETLEEPFVSYADYLINDRAMAVQIAHDEARALFPATVSAAMDSGWSWRIPLRSRIGTGYVFSSAFASDAEIGDALTARNAGFGTLTDPRPVPMRVGRSRRSWVGNCVAIGLASGFLEPLESTSIQFVDYACRRLLQIMPTRDFEPAPIAKFNAEMEKIYEEIRDFLSLHFTLGNREDTPYWRAVRHESKRSDALEACLDIWRHALPDVYDPRHSNVFSFWSVSSVLFGKGFYTQPLATGTDLLPREMWDRHIRETVAVRQAVLASLPDHAEILAMMTDAAVPGATAARVPPTRSMPSQANALGPGTTVMGTAATAG
ncbi:tryptophan 7-halogenase [Sphingomonas sp. LB-2]|uniref:tryptophan halogenase family protein n=1 Tax=Sphingomonas caeni TaxID=2984949 RepID=UPI0022303805|nr:tryptophan halogenase family protein [Sphingomonas caeni]MCW3849404.1 tryptophan 7-halogenase [Sphingomonas caeni]